MAYEEREGNINDFIDWCGAVLCQMSSAAYALVWLLE